MTDHERDDVAALRSLAISVALGLLLVAGWFLWR
jgi:hypothetical protein